MKYIVAATKVEIKKAMRATMVKTTFIIFTIAPLMAALFIYLLMNQELAKKAGQIGSQAALYGEANWTTYTAFLTQILAIGGIIVFTFIFSFIFGREFTDRTITDLLALPYPRSYTVTAKLITSILISTLLTIYMLLVGLLLGLLLKVPELSIAILFKGLRDIILVLFMTLALSFPIPFLASISRGYMLPIGFCLLMIVFAQILSVLGLGGYFPWAIPGLFSGIAGVEEPLCYFSIIIIAILGLVSSYTYWERAELG